MSTASSLLSVRLLKLGRTIAVTALVAACVPSQEEAFGILQSDSPPHERAQAVRVLATSDDPAHLQAVVTALDYPALEVITAAQQGLSDIAEPEQQQAVVTAIVMNGIPAETAGPVLRAYGDAALRVLIPEPGGSALPPQLLAPHLMQLPDAAALRAVAKGLGDVTADVRQQAIELLLTQPERTEALLAAQLDEALRGVRDDAAPEAAIGVPFGSAAEKENTWRANAAMLLNRVDPERHTDRVLAVLLATGPPPEGVETLGNLAARAEVRVLQQLLAEDADAARRATELAVLWAYPSAAPLWRDLLMDSQQDLGLRAQAADALAAQRDPETLQLLPQAMRQAYEAEQDWRWYEIELGADEAWEAEGEEGPVEDQFVEDGSEDPLAEEEWNDGYGESAEESTPPPIPQGDYLRLRQQLLNALAQYGSAAVAPILRGVGEIPVELEYSEVADFGDATDLGEAGYVIASEARGALRSIEPDNDTLLAAWDRSGIAARLLIIEFLEPLNEPRVEALLLDLLDDENHAMSDAAIRALARTPSPPRVRLVELLQGSDPGMAVGAARALGALPADADSVAALIRSLQAEDEFVREAAATALGRFSDRSAVEPLVVRLSEEKEALVQAAIVGALEGMPDARAIPALIGTLASEETWIEEGTGKSVPSVARVLAAIGEPARVPLLAAYRKGKGGERRGALLALAYLDPVTADRLAGEWFDALSDTRSWEDWLDFDHVLNVMSITAQPASAERLVQFARSEKDAEARSSAAGAMAGMRQPVVDAFLREALAKGDLELVAAAHRFYIREAVGEAHLVAALEEHGDEDMALDYLNCGNEALEEAAVTWAEDNGYIVMFSGGEQRAVWGSR